MSQIAHQNDAGGTAAVSAGLLVSAHFGSGVISNQDMDQRAAPEDAPGVSGMVDLRVAPLLLFLSSTDGKRSIVVGHVLVTARSESISLEATIVAAWSENAATDEFALTTEEDGDQRQKVKEQVAAHLRSHVDIPAGIADSTLMAATLAKTLTESSRNTVGDIREVRYSLEACLAESSSDAKATEQYTDVIAALLQLNIICGRAADQAREAAREGLWVHTTDPEAYHAYRKLQDPALINEYAPATQHTRPWMRTHDAAMRQCQELCRQLEKESDSIRMLLAAASSISSSREADAQARFNLLIALLSIGLGIPALFLTMYGANLLLPLNTWPKVGAFLPVGFALLVAGTAAIGLAPPGSKRRVWLICGGIVLLVLFAMIAAAIWAPVTLT